MNEQAIPTRESAHQTVTDFIELPHGQKSIRIGFTDQKVSGRAGLLSFTGFLRWHRFGEFLGKLLPEASSNNRLSATDLGLAFIGESSPELASWLRWLICAMM